MSLGQRDGYRVWCTCALNCRACGVTTERTPPFRCGLFAPTAGAGLTQPGWWGSGGLMKLKGRRLCPNPTPGIFFNRRCLWPLVDPPTRRNLRSVRAPFQGRHHPPQPERGTRQRCSHSAYAARWPGPCFPTRQGGRDCTNPDGSAGVEGGRKPFYDVLMATERKLCRVGGGGQWIHNYPGAN